MSMVMISVHGFWPGWLGCCSSISRFFGGYGGNFALCQDFVADSQAARQAPEVEDYAEFLTARATAGRLHPAVLV